MSSSQSSPTPIEPTLDTNPRENLQDWLSAIGDAARKYCATHATLGALHLACTDALWNAITPPVNGIPVPRPTYPRPNNLIGNETPAVRLVHSHALSLYQDHADTEATLRLAVLKSIGQTNRSAI